VLPGKRPRPQKRLISYYFYSFYRNSSIIISVSRETRLGDGSRIAVIGGGPAGSFFAHFARRRAASLGLAVSTTIFDGKNFLERGPRGCNLCAGVISGNLEARLRLEGLLLPEQRILSRIHGYRLHVGGQTLRLSCAENRQPPIATVFRGNGPRGSCFPGVVSFDDYLLHDARDRGAEIIPLPVWKIELPRARASPAALLFGDRRFPERREFDLIVGAFGVNSFLFRDVQKLGFGYRPPATLTTFQAEYRWAGSEGAGRPENDIHVFLPRSPSIRYVTIVPKGGYATVSVVGRRNATPDLVREALSSGEILDFLSPSERHCFCFPRIPVSGSKRPYAHRFVMIGDASFCRHYKNGIESALVTARLASEAVFDCGLDSAALDRAFFRPARRLIARDNAYGRALFRLNEWISEVPLLSRAHFALAGSRERGRSGAPAKIRGLLWNMFTGSAPYREIFFAALDPRLQAAVSLRAVKFLWEKAKRRLV
jgi:flavin-dependent dehydrogenase